MTAPPTEPPDDSVRPDPVPPDAEVPPARPGLTTFTIEGRAAPGLFVVGWLATLAGLGLVLIGLLSSNLWFLFLFGPLVLTIGLVAGAGSQAIERRARGAAYAGPSPYLTFVTLIPATFAAVAAVGLVLRAIPGSSAIPDYLATLLQQLIQAAVFLGILRLTVVGTDALSWTQMGWRRFDRIEAGNLLRGAAIAVPVIGLTSIVSAVLVALLGQTPESPLPPTGTNAGLVAHLIAGALLAPIAEEAVFRGFAITAWQRTLGDNGAIVRASLMFALAHVINVGGDSLGSAAALFVIGFATRLPVALALGWLFVRARSIWAPLGLHMTFNAVLLILAEVYVRSGSG